MSIGSIGHRFEDYQEYCDVMDETLASVRSPLMNGLPMAGEIRRLIRDKRLFYVQNPDHGLIFTAHDGYFKLYYAAAENAVLRVPRTNVPVVADQLRLDSTRYPDYDALMARSGFTLDRVNVGMERILDDSLRREDYLRREVPGNITVGFAVPGELNKVDRLLRSVFDSVLDELPARDELRDMINGGHVFVLRDRKTIAALMIRIPKGAAAMLHWIAVDANYRNQKLSVLVWYTGDLDCKAKGYHKIVIWVDAKAEGWIHAVHKRGYYDTNQRLFTYGYRL